MQGVQVMSSRYPVAERPSPLNAASAVTCIHCGKPLVVSRWDRINGFLVLCPHCRGFHGRRWNVRALAFASLMLNALSFFFTMRPWRAVLMLVGWIAFFGLVLPAAERWPDAVQVLAFGIAMLGPMVINALLLIRHQVDLDRRPPV